jgi:hypothetical protein
LTSIAMRLRDWAADRDTWDTNLICLGDFNIDRRGRQLWQAFTSTGLTVPEQIDRPRMVAGESLDHYYDPIAWFTSDDRYRFGTGAGLGVVYACERANRQPEGAADARLTRVSYVVPT